MPVAYGRPQRRQSAQDRYGPFATPMNRAGWMALGAAVVYHRELKSKSLTEAERTDAEIGRLVCGVLGCTFVLFT
jgi:hypothetical protein